MNLSISNHAVKQAATRGYTVDDEGRVFNPKGRELKAACSKHGYRKFNIRLLESRNASVKVHRLAAFIRFGEEGLTMLIRHLDGNRCNNSRTNLLPGTPSENMLDRPIECRVRCAKHAAAHRWAPTVAPAP